MRCASNAIFTLRVDDKLYDRGRALFPADVLAWTQTTQAEAWEALTKNHGGAAETALLDRLRKQIPDVRASYLMVSISRNRLVSSLDLPISARTFLLLPAQPHEYRRAEQSPEQQQCPRLHLGRFGLDRIG